MTPRPTVPPTAAPAALRRGRALARSAVRRVALGAVALVGCAAPPTPGDAGDAEAAGARTAYVTVEQQATADEAPQGAAVIARFVKVRGAGVDEAALRWVGVAARPLAGQCVPAGAELGESPVRAVELLDVGAASLELPGGTKPFVVRRLPDPVGLSGGAVYAARLDTLPASLRLEADGLTAIAGSGIELALRPHDGPEGVRVLRDGDSLRVRWTVPASLAGAGSSIAIDVERGGQLIVTCGSDDVGEARVPLLVAAGAAPAADDAAGAAGSLVVVVHRLFEDHDRLRGFDDVVVRHDLARAVELRP